VNLLFTQTFAKGNILPCYHVGVKFLLANDVSDSFIKFPSSHRRICYFARQFICRVF